MSRILAASTVIACSLLSATAAKADPIGSYAGGSVGFNRPDSDVPIAAEGVYAFTDNFQIRATVGENLAVVAPTASISTGQWRFAAGAGLKYSERLVEEERIVPNVFDIDGNPAEEEGARRETAIVSDNRTELVGLAAAERAIGDYGVIFANVTFSNEVTGSIGVGLRF